MAMASHQNVLGQLGCEDLTELIDQDFLEKYGLAVPAQYGMVCKDVRQQAKNLEALGAGPFMCSDSVTGPDWKEWGESEAIDVKMSVAVGYSNGQQIELLGPPQGSEFYKDRIREDGGLTLHHVSTIQDGILEVERSMNAAGFPTIIEQEGGNKYMFHVMVRYFDTREALGIYIEVTQYKLFGFHMPLGERLITAIARLQKLFGR